MATKKKTAPKQVARKSAVRTSAARKGAVRKGTARKSVARGSASKNGTATRVQEMLDREAIRDLPVLYCHCVWKNDIPGIVDLFTEDGEISVPNDPSLPAAKGRENLLKMYQQALGELAPRPFIHNHVVELQGSNRATGTCYVEIRATRESRSWIGAGWYNDEYAKVGGTWKFKSRLVTMHYLVPLSEGWAERPAGREATAPLREPAGNQS
ncbi:MAG: nuclear transport factor 2 family protein [Candidatus Binatia bacterium]